MKHSSHLRLHSFATNEILPMKDETECCEAIESLKLRDDQYEVTRTVMETKLVDFSHTLSIFRHNKKKKQTKDVNGEVGTPKPSPVEVIGEVIG